MRVGLVVHAGRDASVAAAGEAARLLRGHGVEVAVTGGMPEVDGPDADADADAAIDRRLASIAPRADGEDFAPGLDLALSFGGDGTFLRAAHQCRDAGVPVLGVNLGRLGFLAEVEIDDLGPAIRAVARGEFTLEERSTLVVEAFDAAGGLVHRDWALNEVSVEKTARQRLLLMDVHVEGTLFAKVPADALVIATPTGSTAYALSAGGPIVSPGVAATLVVPVAPHSLFDRTLVAGPNEEIRVELVADQPPALVSCDGRPPAVVEAGGRVTARGGAPPVLLARVGLLDFSTLVRRKFGLD